MDNNDFILKIVAELEEKGIKTGFDKLKKAIEKDPAKIDVILDTSGTLGRTKGSVKKLAAEIHNEISVAISKLQKQGQDINFDLSVGDVEEVINNVINHTKKLEQNFDSASAKAQKFLAQFNKKSGGVLINSAEFKAVQEAIDGLGNTHSIEDLNKSMNTFEITYDNIVSNLRNGGKSLNPFINAINDMKNMDSTLKGIELDYQSLASKPKDVANSIKELYNQQQKVNQYSQGTIEWSQEYGILQSKIVQVKNEIQNVAKAEKASNTNESNRVAYYQRIIDNNKTIYSLKNKLLTADQEQTKEINRQIKALEERNRYNYNQLSEKGLTDNSWEQNINSSKNALENQLRINEAKQNDIAHTREIAQAEKEAANVVKERQSIEEQIHEIQLLSNGGIDNDYDTQLAKLTGSFTRIGLKEEEIKEKTSGVTHALSKLRDRLAQPFNESNYDEIISLNQKLQTEFVNSRNESVKMNATMKMATDSSRLNNVNQIQKWADNNSRAMKKYGKDINRIIAEMGDLNKVMSQADASRLLNEFKSIQKEAGKAGISGMTAIDKIKKAVEKFGGWSMVTGSVTTLWHQLQRIPKEVYEIDTAMVELTKVSDASSFEIKKYFDEAAESAKKYGSAVSDMINATADWSRLGYNLPDSKKLAEIATLYTNVGDGIDMSTANEHLISTLQGFKMTADEAIHVIDSFNEVANTEAINTAGIGEALQRSASSMYAAGNTLEETIGLVTAANAVVQDPDSIGTAYKTISMRIRGAKTEMEELGLETEDMIESTATLQKEILALSGVDIMKDKDTFKSTYQILDELASKWQDLTDIQQASITELIAGKRQGNIVSALMSNFETARRATETAINSTGSALEEQEEYEKGIEYSLKRLEAAFQTFSNHILDSGFIKGIVDFGSNTIEVIDKITSKLGSLEIIGLSAGLFTGLKNVGMV